MTKKRRNKSKKTIMSQILTESEKLVLDLAKIPKESEDSYRIAQSLIKSILTYGSLTNLQKTLCGRILAAHKLSLKVEGKVYNRPKVKYLYAITSKEDANFPVKLGFSCDPNRRKNSLQTGCSVKLEIFWKVSLGNLLDAQVKKYERKLHKMCNKYKLRGEWFHRDCLKALPDFEGTISDLIVKESPQS